MNKFCAVVAGALGLSVALSSVAEARDGFYVALRGGYSDYNMNDFDEDNASTSSKVDFDGVWQVSGALGYKYKYFRAEAEYIYRDESDDEYRRYILNRFAGTYHAKIEIESVMFNAYLDFMPNYWISPYIMGGIGWAGVKYDAYDKSIGGTINNKDSYDDNNFAWQWGGGLSLRLNRCLNFDMGYQYANFNKLKGAEINAHVYYGGLRFTF